MPTINYCDFAAGDDSTGDGTAGNPYKTIDKASTGLIGGGEVRCAKSAAPSAMSGTMTFTDGSTSVATSEDLTGSLAAKDYVGLNTAGETWWEISSITSTTITLVKAYSGTGGTGTGYKLGVTDTGDCSAYSAAQNVSASGSFGNRIKISGGWNLSGTPAQDGQTWFWQSGAARDGYGIYQNSRNYIEVSDLGFLRYDRGDYIKDSIGNKHVAIVCNGSTYGFYSIGFSNEFELCVANGCVTDGILINNWSGAIIRFSEFNSNGSYGIHFATNTYKNIVQSCICNRNNRAIYAETGSECSVFGLSHDETVWNYVIYISAWNFNRPVIASIQESESGGAARNRIYFYGGYTQDNTADARSGSCLQFNPKSATYWIEQSFFVPAAASTARTVSIYLKDDSSFNGSVWLELWFNGVRITGPTEQTMTTSYQQFSIVGAAGNIPVAGVLELKVLVYGTAGCVYADDISYS